MNVEEHIALAVALRQRLGPDAGGDDRDEEPVLEEPDEEAPV